MVDGFEIIAELTILLKDIDCCINARNLYLGLLSGFIGARFVEGSLHVPEDISSCNCLLHTELAQEIACWYCYLSSSLYCASILTTICCPEEEVRSTKYTIIVEAYRDV
jgi:hypothetical protein